MKDIKLEDVLPIDADQYFTTFISTPDAKYNYLIAKVWQMNIEVIHVYHK